MKDVAPSLNIGIYSFILFIVLILSQSLSCQTTAPGQWIKSSWEK